MTTNNTIAESEPKTTQKDPPVYPGWPKIVPFGRVKVIVYKRKTPAGRFGYMVSNYSTGKRRMDSYKTSAEALDAAKKLAQRLSEQHTLAAQLTNDQALEYVAASTRLKSF